MANQMIALQARAPQSPGLGSAIQQNAQMINMLMQQRLAERQTAKAQQEMELARNKETRDIAAADIDLAGKQIDYHYKQATAVRTPQGYEAWLASVGKDSPEFEQFFRTNLPPSEFDRNELIKMVGSVKDNFDATYAPVQEQLTYSPTGAMQRTRTGGFEGQGVYPLEEYEMDTAGGGAIGLGQPTPVDGGQGGPMLSMPGVGPSRVSTDMASQLTNARNDPEYQQALKLIQRMNPQAAQSLRQIMPKFQPELMATIRAEAQKAFGGQAAQPPATEFPLVAGPRGGPLEGYSPTGRQAVGKPPLQSPTPGIYTVPPSQVTTTSQAEKTGAEEATRLTDLKKALPKAKGALGLATKQLARDIADIDYVLTNPYREMVVGQIEGRLPSAVNIFRSGGQEAQNVQDRLDKINASSVVKHLQQMRDASPQGSSLFGQVTEYEDRLVAALAGLKQTQDEPTFERALREYRNVLVEMYQNLPQVFNDTYGEIGAKEIVPSAAKPPRKSPTIADVEYLRRNRNNPNVVNGFRQHFGDTAYKMAIGGR